MDKDHILSEIKRYAEENSGKSPGIDSFRAFSDIKQSDWRGKYWINWSEAVAEAGLAPNKKTAALDRDEVAEKFIGVIRETGKLPTDAHLRMKARTDPDFPAPITIQNHLGKRAERIAFLYDYCRGRYDLSDVAEICSALLDEERDTTSQTVAASRQKAYVYMFKYGKKHYKIGMTKDPLRRLGEVKIDVPEELTPIHTIETDRPRLVEKFWHDRFEEKHTNGEFYALTTEDVRLFRSIKTM